jgi:hypothetical protein
MMLFGLLALSASSGVARAQDLFAQHCDRAIALAENDQYVEALKELEAAYQIKQPPSLLYSLGKTHRRLGNAKEALSYYERFLTAETNLIPAMKRDVDREIAELRVILGIEPPMLAPGPRASSDPYEDEQPGARRAPPRAVAPGAMMPPLQVHYEVRKDRGLIAGGITLLATGYFAAVLTGSLELGTNGCSDFCGGPSSAASGTLLIPILGPFISGFIFLNWVWTAPWILLDGAGQVAGLAMIIAGARAKIKVPIYGERFNVRPFALLGGGGVIVSGRF